MDTLKYIIVCLLYRFSFSFNTSPNFPEMFMRCRSRCGSEKCNSLCNSRHRLNRNSNCSEYCMSAHSWLQICPELCKLGKFFLERGTKQGSCPTSIDGFALARINQCVKDIDCPATQKCCSNEQWRTCQQAVFKLDENLPPIPNYIIAKAETSSSALILWRSHRRKFSAFYIELRYSTKIVRPNENEMTSWKPAGQTSRRSIKVKGLIPGAWYQFRISAWSENGTNGFNSSNVIQLPGLVRRPSQPRNVSASGAWFRAGKVDVLLSWQRPLILDVPVRRYRILWFRHVLGSIEHYQPVQVHRIRVRGTKFNALLRGLELNATYMVQIQAIIRGAGQPRIKGRWKSILIKTPPMNPGQASEDNRVAATNVPITKPKKNDEEKRLKGLTKKEKYNQAIKALNITLSRLAMSGDGHPTAILKCDSNGIFTSLRISWIPSNCSAPFKKEARSTLVSTKHKEIQLLELRANCIYNVKVIPFMRGGRRGQMEMFSFATHIQKIHTENKFKQSMTKPTIKLKEGNGAASQRDIISGLMILCLLLTAWWTLIEM